MRYAFVVLCVLLGACSGGNEQQVRNTGPPVLRPARHFQRRALPFRVFREELAESAGRYYPDYLDDQLPGECAELPDLTGYLECGQYALGNTSFDFKEVCLQTALKALIVGELCSETQEFVADAAQLASVYATQLAESDPCPELPLPQMQHYTAALVARQYLSEDDARRPALRMYAALKDAYYVTMNAGGNASAVAQQMRLFALGFLDEEQVNEAAHLATSH